MKKMTMTILTREEIISQRKEILEECNKKTVIKKGDKRVHGSRFCAVCQTPLSVVLLSNQKTVAVRNHFSCHFSDLLTINICHNSKRCRYVHKRLREGDTLDEILR